ncbi:hypothetical protein EGH24_08735 [Halonotius terrestris]|uniref:Uncharacterized protein n=1 Tax=Halonotius terrestris TaxID=2487750 RepID=A0A8J8P9G8_9EURY|nr:hypothetical protein [Halonotius terrestris]TQQ81206.1 hypothetical protein EGH24_08735 [Halonotius terrestris]
MNATTSQPTENWAGDPATTDDTAQTPDTPDSLAASLATAERASNTDATTETATETTTESATETTSSIETTGTATTTTETAETTETTTHDGSSASAPTDEVSIPTRLPDPETTIYRDTTTVIRLLQTETMDETVEIRLYRSDDEAVDHIEPDDGTATDGGRSGDSGIAALPEPTRQRFKTAVDAAAERFDLTRQETGRCRERRPHGAKGVLEFAARLTDR